MNGLRIIIERWMLRYLLKRTKQLKPPKITEEEKKSLYQSYPYLRNYYTTQARLFKPFFAALSSAIGVISVVLLLFSPDIQNKLVGLLMLPFCPFFIGLYHHVVHYNEHTGCYYYEDYVMVKRYRRQDYILTYEEIEEYIKKEKISIHRGGIKIPYSHGRIPLYVFGEPPVDDNLFTFLNKKCDIRIPKLDKRRKDIIRRTAIGWSIYGLFGIPLLTVASYMSVVCYMGDAYEIGTGIQDYFNYLREGFLGGYYFFGGVIVIGLLLRLIFFIPAWFEFHPYKKLIKVR